MAEAVPHVLKRLKDVVDQFHRAGLFFFTFGDANNAMEHYSAQRAAGVDAIILDDTARLAKVPACYGQQICSLNFWGDTCCTQHACTSSML